MKNNIPRLHNFRDDPGHALEHGAILLPHTIMCVYQHCDKFLSQLTLIMHLRTIIPAKILLSSNPTVMIVDKLTRLFNSRYGHMTVLRLVIVIWKWQCEQFASDMQLDIADFVITACFCPLKPVIFCSLW